MAGVAISEWDTRINGFIAACGEAAVAVVTSLYGTTQAATGTVTQFAREAIATGHTTGAKAASGETSPSDLQWLAAQHGVAETITGDWQSAVAAASPTRPVILGVGNASVFGGSDAGVKGHYIDILGRSGNTVTVADPNTQQATQGQTVQYTLDQLSRALPFAALVPQTAAAPSTSTAANGGGPSLSAGPVTIDLSWLPRAGIMVAGGALALLGVAVLLFDRDSAETAGKLVAM